MTSQRTLARFGRVLSRLFLALGVSFSGGAFASQPNPDNCADRVVDLGISTNFTDGLARPTVEFAETSRGRHGGNRLKLVRDEIRPWMSSYAKFHFDIQGDPRWFIGAFGTDVAKFFGFEILNDQELMVPDVEEFRGALAKVNEALGKMGMGFETVELDYRVVRDSTNTTPLSTYLHNFVDHGQLNMAAGGTHLVHDLSFHTGSIILPKELIGFGRMRVEYVLKFHEYAIVRAQADKNDKLASDLISLRKVVKDFLVKGIDNGTGFANIWMIAEKAKDDAYVIGKISNLISVMHNGSTKPASLPLMIAAYFVFGTPDVIEFHRDKRYIYKFPKLDGTSFTLNEYTADLFRQYLQVQGDAKAPETVAAYAREFASQNRQLGSERNLLKVVAPINSFFKVIVNTDPNEQTEYEVLNEDVLHWHSAFKRRMNLIEQAVKKLAG